MAKKGAERGGRGRGRAGSKRMRYGARKTAHISAIKECLVNPNRRVYQQRYGSQEGIENININFEQRCKLSWLSQT
jgi:hypothetical protein